MPTVMQWTKHLLGKVEDQQAYAAPYEQRYQNKYVLPFLISEYQEVYGSRADHFATAISPPRAGMAGITVDALVDRLVIIGAQSESAEAARVVENAWEDNDLDVMYREAHREALIGARSFAQVDASADGSRAVVGIESAEQVAIHREAQPPYDPDAAIKVMTDEWTGKRTARLWLRSALGHIRRIDQVEGDVVTSDPEGSGESSRWTVTHEAPSRHSRIPVVEFASKPRLLMEPVSEIEPIDSLVDIVDLIEGLMVFAGHFGAVPIRWASGLAVQRDPKDPSKPLLGADGKPKIGFNPRADHMWVSTSKDAKFGQLEPASLATFIAWAEHAAHRIRAKTQIASTYYSMDLKSHMSAELLKTDEAPMVRRVNSIGRDGSFGQAWRQVDRMILEVERPDLVGARVKPRWGDPQTRIENQDADTFSKLTTALGPAYVARKVLGWSPQEAEDAVAEWESLRNRESDPFAALLGEPLTDAAASDV